MDARPIGVFDSGLGGLTVLRVLRDRFPHENFVYLGDTARLPYGSKSPQIIRRYSEQNLHFLTQMGVKAVIVACNSASTQMRESEIDGLPLYNVIEPGARAALAASPRKRIGLIGTRATVLSRAYEDEIRRLDPSAEVFTQACPLLVPLAEEGWDGDPVANLIVYRYLQAVMQHQIDVLIMGCTHYPLLEGSISRVTGSSVTLVDSGEAIAQMMASDFKAGRVPAGDASKTGTLKLCVTDAGSSFQEMSRRILGPDAPAVELV
ncbi:MAG: glutamate racemase [Bdellovibrionaceae bacterium]|nr:glutamate racemase [Pseudobdellovibrionaceae bacterium]MBX3034803.1 glutamate racemase [Pseudobdellovibrionaceae bacterium]